MTDTEIVDWIEKYLKTLSHNSAYNDDDDDGKIHISFYVLSCTIGNSRESTHAPTLRQAVMRACEIQAKKLLTSRRG